MSSNGGHQFPDFGSYSGGGDQHAQGTGQDHDAYGQGSAGEHRDPYTDPYGGSSAMSPSPAYQQGFAAQPDAGTQGYGQPAYTQAPSSSGMAIAGLVLGIVSFVACAGLTAPLGLIFSIMGMRETAPTAANPKGGRGLAIAGLVTSIIGCLMLLAVIAYFVLIIGLGIAGSTY